MIIKTRMEEDWKKQVSARHSEIVGKAGKAPFPSLPRKPAGPALLQSYSQGSALCLPCKLPAAPSHTILRYWGRLSWKLPLVGLLIADIKQESNQSSHGRAERD